jgi:hypothetical protein
MKSHQYDQPPGAFVKGVAFRKLRSLALRADE